MFLFRNESSAARIPKVLPDGELVEMVLQCAPTELAP